MRTDAENHFYSALDLVPGLRDTVASGRREGRFTGTGDLPNLYRTSAGPGWALAGDAGHHQDPSTGMGMSDAFQAAELLAEAIHDGLAGHRPIDEALAGYQHQRDELTAEWLRPHPGHGQARAPARPGWRRSTGPLPSNPR